MTTTDQWTDHDFTVSDGTKLHYVEMGRGTPVVLIHGAGGSAVGNWFRNGIAPALAPTNRVVGIDMRGHGLSEAGPPDGRRNMAADVLEFLAQMGIERAHIGGYSMGGGITLQILATSPEKFITAHFGGSGIPETPELAATIPTDKEGPAPDEPEAQAVFRRTPRPAGEAVGNAGIARPITDADREEFARRRAEQARGIDLSAITFPVLAVNGEYDRPLQKTHRMWRELTNFTSVVLPGKGHLSAVMPGFIPSAYVEAMVRFVTTYNPS